MSLIAWLDTSADEQRRVREIVALFADKGTLDELGIGQVRDAFSDFMFPGTSTIQTRARYLLFVPWIYERAAKSSTKGSVRRRGEAEERRFITTMKLANQSKGLIGQQAGVNVKTLPSAIYWSALIRYGILTSPLSIDQVGSPARVITGADELVDRVVGAWSPTLPPPPPTFPQEVDGGFDLTAEEAGWLGDRIMLAAPNSVLSHLIRSDAMLEAGSTAPWNEPACNDSGADIQSVVHDAEMFSFAMEGAALLYNLLVAERYEASGFTSVPEPKSFYTDQLERWAAERQALADDLRAWDTNRMWRMAYELAPRIGGPTRQFVDAWIQAVMSGRADHASVDAGLRSMITARESMKKGNQSRLTNDRMLARWQGASGQGRLVFRWSLVKRLVSDIKEGLARAGT